MSCMRTECMYAPAVCIVVAAAGRSQLGLESRLEAPYVAYKKTAVGVIISRFQAYRPSGNRPLIGPYNSIPRAIISVLDLIIAFRGL